MMKYLVLIQARMGSSRLSGKVLKDICGKPDIEWVIERVRRSKRIDDLMVITSIEKNNLPLIQKCAELDTRVFVGSEEDVLDRYYQAARLLRPEYVIRITADCPMYDWNVLDAMIDSMDSDTDYMNIEDDTFPDGLDTEIMTFNALERAWNDAKLSSEREHVTLYIRNHSEIFKLQHYKFPLTGTGHYRWTLDEEADYEMITMVYQYFSNIGKEDFSTRDILEFLEEHPEVADINGRIGRNEGLEKSLKNDKMVQ